MSISIQATWLDNILHKIPGEIYVTLIIVVLVLILGIVVWAKARKADPLVKPKGILNIAEIAVTAVDGMVESSMGKSFKKMAPYFLAVGIYLISAFLIGLVGLPTPVTNIIVPLCMALCTVVLIHATAIKNQGWKYFKRYTDPVILFLPMNIISQIAPLISLTFRLLGNAIAGWSIMSLVYWALDLLSKTLFGGFIAGGAAGIWLAPLITPWLHLYFDLFSGAIQTIVFMMLSMMFIAQEGPDEEEVKTQEITDKAGNKITTLAKEK